MNSYTALIRTFNSSALLAKVIDSLMSQTWPPERIVFVDSSDNNHEKLNIKAFGFTVIQYPNEDFNFSKAINIGVEEVTTEYVLIISSHVVLTNTNLIEDCINNVSIDDQKCLGFSIYPIQQSETELSILKVDETNFSPIFGLSNSCAVLRTSNILQRPFREDVFSAEDQEWASYYVRNKNMFFYSIGSDKLLYLNQNMNIQKKINEEIAMAYFTHQHLRSPTNIIFRTIRGFIACLRNRPERAKYHIAVAKELLLTYFRKPNKKSKYF